MLEVEVKQSPHCVPVRPHRGVMSSAPDTLGRSFFSSFSQ